MKFYPKNIVLLIAMLLFMFSVAINAQNDENDQVDDQTKKEQPENDENNPPQNGDAEKAEDDADAEDDANAEDDAEEKPQEEKWLDNLASDNEKEVAEALDKLSTDLSATIDVVTKGLSHSNPIVRGHCADILSKATDHKEKVTKSFVNALKSEDDVKVIKKMMGALVAWQAAEEELVKLLEHEIPAVRMEAVNSLVALKKEQALDTLFSALKTESYPDVKAAIYEKFCTQGDDKQLAELLLELAKLDFSQEKDEVLEQVVACATKHKKQIGTDILMRVAQNATSNSVRVKAVENVLPLIDRENIGVLVSLLWDEDVNVRQKAFGKLSQTTGKTFGYNAKADLTSRVPSIGEWQKWKQIDELVYWLDAAEADEAEEAYNKILEYGISSTTTLIENYDNASASGKERIINLLGNYPTPQALVTIAKGLGSDNAAIKKASTVNTFRAWKKLQDPKILVPLQNVFDAAQEKDLSLAFNLAQANYKNATEFVQATIKDGSSVEKTLEYVTPAFYGELANHISQKNAIAKKVVTHLLQEKNPQAWSVLSKNFSHLESADKITLLHDLQEVPSEYANLGAAFSAEKDSDVVVAFCNNLPVSELEKSVDGAMKKYAEADAKAKTALLGAIAKVNNDATKSFFEKLSTAEGDMQIAAVENYLNLLGDKKDSYIAERLKKETNAAVRLKLHGATTYTKEDYDKLQQALDAEKDTAVKKLLVERLHSLDAKKSQELLVALVTNGKDSELQKLALSKLDTKDNTLADKLVEVYSKTQDASLQNAILSTLSDVKPQKAAEFAKASLEKSVNVAVFSVLVKTDAAAAKKHFANVMENSTTEQKVEIIKNSGAIMGKEHVATLLPFIINDESQELFDATQSALKSIMGSEEVKAEEISAWNQKYQAVVKNLNTVLTSDKEDDIAAAKKALAEHKTIATNEIVSHHATNAKAIGVLSGWQTPETTNFFNGLTQSGDAKLRKAAYEFLAGDANFAKEAATLYLFELDLDAKLTLLNVLLKAYPEVYQDKLAEFVKSAKNNDVVFSLLNKYADSNIIAALLPSADEKLQKTLLSLVEKNVNNENLRTTAKQIVDGNEETAKPFLAALKGYSALSDEARTSRKSFVTWWLEYKKELVKQEKVYTVLENLASSDILERKNAAKELSSLEIKDKALEKYLDDAQVSSQGKIGLLSFLAASPTEEQISLFSRFLDDENKSLQLIAVNAIAKIGYDKAPNVITNLAKNDDAKIRFAAIQAIGKSSKDAADLLRNNLGDVDFRVREEAYYWLLQRKEASKETSLEMFAENQPLNIQNMAVDHLKSLGENSIIPKLIAHLNNPFPEMRANAYSALVSLSGENIAFDAEAEERKESIAAWNSWWVKHKQEEELQGLVASLSDPQANIDEVKKRIISFGAAAASLLKEELNSPMGVVRKYAVETLGEMKRRDMSIEIARLLSDSDINVRMAAKKAVESLSGAEIKDLVVDAKSESEWQSNVAKVNTWWTAEQAKLQVKHQEAQQATKKKVDELLSSLSDEKADGEKVAKDVAKLGSSAIEFVEKQLANDNAKVVVGAIEALVALDAKQSVEQIILLLQKEATRKAAEKALKKLIGELPMESVEAVQRQEQVKNLQAWWQTKSEELKNDAMSKIDEITTALEADGKIEDAAKKLAALNDHTVIVDYLADKRLAVKQAIVSALIEINSKDSVAALQPYLSGTEDAERTLIINAVRAITGEAFAPQAPKDEKEWDQVNTQVEKWAKDWAIKKQEALRNVEEQLKKAVADNKVDETVKELSSLGKEAANSAKALLNSKEEKEQLAALSLSAAVKSTTNVAAIIDLANHQSEKVRDAATKALIAISGSELPERPDQEKVWGIQIAKLQNFWKEKQEQSIDSDALTSTLKEVAGDMTDDDAKAALNKYGHSVVSAISPLLVDKVDSVRLGAVKAMGLIGDFNQGIAIAATLSDSHLKVRKHSYDLLSKWAGSKPEVAFSPVDEDKWQEKVDTWFAKWKEQEQKSQVENITKNLQKDAEKVKTLQNIWTQEQVEHTRKIVEYLKSPIKEVRDQAADILNDGPASEASKNEDVQYDDEARSQEDIDANYNEYVDWLSNAEKNLETLQSEVQTLLDDLDKQKEELQGGINTLDDYEDVRDIIGEMADKTNPKVLKKYAELLEKYGCDVSKFDPYAGEEARSDQLYNIETSIYSLRQKLEEQADTSDEVEESIEDKLDVKQSNTLEDLDKIAALVSALEKNIDYQLRSEIANTLQRATGNLQGYDASANKKERDEALQSWKEWLTQQKKSIEDQQKAQSEKIAAAVKSLEEKKDVATDEDVKTAELLIAALSGSDREKALGALKAANGDKEAEDWSKWLAEKKKSLQQSQNVQQALSTVNGLTKVASSASEAMAIGVLVNSLQDEKWRAEAYKALEAYTNKYAQTQVREGFGYDAKAPIDKLEKPIADWKKWYTKNVGSIVRDQEQQTSSVLQLGKTLLNNNFANSRGLYAAKKLVESLRSDSVNVREAAITALEGYTKTNYGYDVNVNPQEQNEALRLWDAWLAHNKSNLLEEVYGDYLETGISSRVARRRALEMITILKAKNPIAELSNVAISWLRRETGKDLTWSDNAEERSKTLSEIDAWFKLQEPIYRIDSIASDLKGGVTTPLDLQNVKLLVSYLDSAEESTRAKAISELNKLANNVFDWDPKADKEKRDLAKKDIDAWLAEQNAVVPLRDKAAVLKSKEDVTRDNVKDLVDALGSSYSSARKIAADALSPYFPESVDYDPDASEEKRENALGEIRDWFEELE
ncbi:HEAT repeat domain-containing protein [Candidatus Uabimicrobium amorphum]|uniref:TOG domain-containing protein n=1 Tax=Uabimicrobium amorphum TaxID=2596890 RepID=A0A5S9IIV4_UABAM|nr:HEAT repeat domain-containing protein [Candidatus Uabimicrobium amorphum]BBM82341.1 hypothetical protein UABAM_00684 [Candidatus Uabimicrobium amorphum]